MGSPYADEQVPQAIIDAANAPPPPYVPSQAVPAPRPAPAPPTQVAPAATPGVDPEVGLVTPPPPPSIPPLPVAPAQAVPTGGAPTTVVAPSSQPAPTAGTAPSRALPEPGTTPAISGTGPASTGSGAETSGYFQPSATSAPFNPQNTVAVGDSLAAHLTQYAGVSGNWSGKVNKYEPGNTAVAGADPEGVFKLINDMPDATIKGKDIVLSTGKSNAAGPFTPTQVAAVVHQIDTLRAKGANTITVMGLGNRKDVDPRANDALMRIARDNGAIFSGALDPANLSDGIHAKNYNQVRDQVYQAATGGKGSSTPQQTNDPSAGGDTNVPTQQQGGYYFGATGTGGGHVAPKAERLAYYEQLARANGLNPYALFMTTAQEGLHNYTGDNGKSFGDFQMYTGGGMGNLALQAGIDIRNPNTWREQAQFAVQQMVAHRGDTNWFAGQWHGPRDRAPWAVQNIFNPNAPPPAGFSLAGGGGGSGRYGGRTGVGVGGEGSGSSGGANLQTFQQNVQGKDHQGFLTMVAGTPTPSGFDGWMAKWMMAENRVALDAIYSGHADQVPAIRDAFTRMGYQGMNMNLMNMYQALDRGDINAAASYGSLAYAHFPDGAHVSWSTDGKGNLFAQRTSEADGKPLGAPMQMTKEKILSQARFTSDPDKFMKFLSDQQTAVAAQTEKTAHASYLAGRNGTLERIAQIDKLTELARTDKIVAGARERAIIAQQGKPEQGQRTQQQLVTEQKEIDEELQTTGLTNGVKLDNTPQGNQLRQKLNAVSSSLLIRNPTLSKALVVTMVQKVGTGEYGVALAKDASGKIDPNVAVIVDKKTGQTIAPIDMTVAIQHLGFDPQKSQQQQQAAPPSSPQPTQAVPTGAPG